MEDALLRTEDVARLLGVRAQTVRTWRARHRGPTYFKISRNIVAYSREAVEEWLGARAFRHTSEEAARGPAAIDRDKEQTEGADQ